MSSSTRRIRLILILLYILLLLFKPKHNRIYLWEIVETKVEFHKISEADKGQTVNLNEAASRGCDTLEVSQAQTGEVTSAKKGNIIPTNVQNLQKFT